MHRIFAAIAVVAGLVPAAARADWQYTKWGMEPEEAVTASNGTMKILPAKIGAGPTSPTRRRSPRAPSRTARSASR